MVDGTTTVGALRTAVRRFVRERDWERFHLPKDLAIAISVEASELLERFLWRDPAPAATLSSEDRSAIAEELADVVIYGVSLADVLEVDLSDAVLAKLKKDEAKYPADRYRGRAR
ncbi:MAG: nucleotide pyrophosphohydrolase [Methanobacteriota archaeon]|nr:MAG: nucleotide pyrophosphohydrolase [Euryarchaeota archaeon]TLZ78587.1 MAG: nucleotide pyrophosphohydrolase [Euryarchaeota archaeon]